MNQPLDPENTIKKLPAAVVNSIVNSVNKAYQLADQIVEDYPLCQHGPHQSRIVGFNRYAFIENSVHKDWEEGILIGHAEWIPFSSNESGYYLLYKYNGISITFSHIKQPLDLPKRSEYRLDRAHDNQLRLNDPFYHEAQEDSANFVFVHGDKNLDFARIIMLGVNEAGQQVALYRSENLVQGNFGQSVDSVPPSTPITPANMEIIQETKLQVLDKFIEKEQNSDSNE